MLLLLKGLLGGREGERDLGRFADDSSGLLVLVVLVLM